MVASGKVNIRDYDKLCKSRDSYITATVKVESNPVLENYWYVG